MRRFLLLMLTLGLIVSSNAQISSEQNYVPGEILVKVNRIPGETDLQELKSSFEITLISRNFNIYLFKYDFQVQDYLSSIELLKKFDWVEQFQKNHRVTRRTVPNDPLYSDQWQHPHIQSEKIWEMQTSGVTAFGDTIVIALIDDGIDATHPDLADNVWYNRHETRNGLDDDGNGYIDDLRGWNSYLHADSIFDPIEKASHGTPVAGIIGAVGDNGIGIAGINWHVKLMATNGGSVESDIVESYDYILSNKKLYLSSNGNKGAFVVATNSSFGTDGLKPEDAPLWCAMYDSMGKYGIMSMGATSNSNVNVDVEGDLPSLCPSKFFISVTDTDKNDKINGTGFGQVNVDIGAPGHLTKTTASWVDTASVGGWYRSFGHTSAATPYVTAAMGVLFSNACDSYLNLYQSDPEAALGLARKFILEGVDSSTLLATKISSGGRLNLYKMVAKMNEWCFPVSNPEPPNSDLHIYPNPTSGLVSISSEVEWSKMSVEIHDVVGRQIFSGNSENSNKLDIDLSLQVEGVYFISVLLEGGVEIFQYKVVKN
jgi:serine protease